tara:strand:- start:573 stop:872 length:300 start_codon:yes stop_codon:yes gene_type:complete
MSRLFVLVNNELPLAYQGVQAGHAVAQWLIDHPNQTWNNSYLIYLGVSEQELHRWMYKLQTREMDFTIFREPDIDNDITAIACQADDHKLFRNLKLMGA